MEDKKAVDFQQSQVMPGRPKRDSVIALALVLLPIILVAAVLIIGDRRGRQASTVEFEEPPAAQLSAMRWQAMANYYRDHNLLTGDRSGAKAVDPADRKFFNGSSLFGLPKAEFRLDSEGEAFYTQKYWDMAAGSAKTAEPVEDNDAYYTQKYWEWAAEEKEAAEPMASDRIYRHGQPRHR